MNIKSVKSILLFMLLLAMSALITVAAALKPVVKAPLKPTKAAKTTTVTVQPLEQFRSLVEDVITERDTAAFELSDIAHAGMPGWKDDDLLAKTTKITKLAAHKKFNLLKNGIQFNGQWTIQSNPLNLSGTVQISGIVTTVTKQAGSKVNATWTANVVNGVGTLALIGYISPPSTPAVTYHLDLKKAITANNALPALHTIANVTANGAEVYLKDIIRALAKSNTEIITGTFTVHALTNLSKSVSGKMTGITRAWVTKNKKLHLVYQAGTLDLTSTLGYSSHLTAQANGALTGSVLDNTSKKVGSFVVEGWVAKLTK